MNYLEKLLMKFLIYSLSLVILIFFISRAMFINLGADVYLLYVSILAVIYIPISLISGAWRKNKKEEKEDKEDVLVVNEIQHFREVVEKALNGNPVAQRDVEMRILTMADVNLKIRYDLSDKALRMKFGNEEFMREHMGHAGEIIAKFYRRRHDLNVPVPKEEFKRDVEEVLEAMR